MFVRLRTYGICLGIVVGGVMGAPDPGSAQIPDQFTNLRVFPKDVSKRDLVAAMKEFTAALGVRCNFCHVPGKDPGSLEGFDFASDEPKHKLAAREMMKMVAAINGDFIPKAGLESPTRVRCVTCHRGVEEPETLDRVLLKVAETEGLPAAEAKYRELRTAYYGSGSYDFSSDSIYMVADGLARKNNLEGAVAMATLNLEFHPEEADCYAALAQFQAAAGQTEAAIKNMEKAIEMSPDNDRYPQMLEKMRSGK